MSDEILHAIQIDDVKELERLRNDLGDQFLTETIEGHGWSINFAMSQGSYEAASYLVPVGLITYIPYIMTRQLPYQRSFDHIS